MPADYKITKDAICTLPIGLERDGERFQEVVLDKWRGEDQHRLTEPAARKNPGKAMSMILRRLIQAIPGVMEQKSNKHAMISEHYVTEMFVADRDFLMLQSLALSGQCEREIDFTCENSRCQKPLTEDVDITDIVVTPQDPEKRTFFEFCLPDDGVEWTDPEGNAQVSRKGKFNYPRGSDQEKISRYSDEGTFALFTRLITRCVSDFEGLRQISMDDAKKMTIEDRKYLQELSGDKMPGPDETVETECEYCGKEQTVSIELSSFFL